MPVTAPVTSVLGTTRRRGKQPPRRVPPAPVPSPPATRIVEGDADLSVAEQEAQDNRILALIDRLWPSAHRRAGG